MISKKELEAELAENDAKIKELTNEIKRIQDRQSALKNMLIKMNEAEATQRLLNSIYEVNENNSIYVQLDAGTRTTPIMDNFYYSDKKFLVFENAFYLSDCRSRVSLVITKGCNNVNYKYNGLTMTDLKKAVKSYIGRNTLKYLKKESRIYPLYQELTSVAKKIQKDETTNVMAFQTPCMIGGQTYTNQSGYGSEYCGEDMIYQGTLYGETSKFLIIGVITKERKYY